MVENAFAADHDADVQHCHRSRHHPTLDERRLGAAIEQGVLEQLLSFVSR